MNLNLESFTSLFWLRTFSNEAFHVFPAIAIHSSRCLFTLYRSKCPQNIQSTT